MKKTVLYLLTLCLLGLSGCAKHEIIFDHPFIYITDKHEAMTSTINCMGSTIEAYTVYFSSKMPNKDIEVYFDIVIGAGLVEGVDFNVLTPPSAPLTFPNGTFQREIRVQWFAHTVDRSKDNTLKIILTGNSENHTLGMPGPSQNFIHHTITKILID